MSRPRSRYRASPQQHRQASTGLALVMHSPHIVDFNAPESEAKRAVPASDGPSFRDVSPNLSESRDSLPLPLSDLPIQALARLL